MMLDTIRARSLNPQMNDVIEGYNQTLYKSGIAMKAHTLYKATRLLGEDLFKIANSCIPTGYLQAEALAYPFTPSASSEASSMPGLSTYIINPVLNRWKVVSQHPFFHSLRQFCFVKQTCDFSIAFFQWMQGTRDGASMARNAVNTALSYIPLALSAYEGELSIPSQFISNTILLGCLAYSIRIDYLSSQSQEYRESSPSIAMIKKFFDL